jgi:hypothetical protein
LLGASILWALAGSTCIKQFQSRYNCRKSDLQRTNRPSRWW